MDRANFAEPRRAQLFTQRVARRTTSGARLGSRVCAPFKRCLRNSIDGQVRAVVKTESQLVVKLRCPFFKEGLPLWGTSLEGRVDPDLQRRADHRVWIRRWWNPLALVGSDRANYVRSKQVHEMHVQLRYDNDKLIVVRCDDGRPELLAI
ncbi:hypothetical protein ACJJTC_001474 [Scirpophaga incertulas]